MGCVGNILGPFEDHIRSTPGWLRIVCAGGPEVHPGRSFSERSGSTEVVEYADFLEGKGRHQQSGLGNSRAASLLRIFTLGPQVHE